MQTWKNAEKSLIKDFEFSDFSEALEFVSKVGELAQKEDHHPDILIHDYSKVKVILTTHSEDGVTEKDHSLAEKINNI